MLHLYLQYPIGLLAMAGIIIPVAVHLWNDRRGKVLRIGSIELLAGSTRRPVRSPRITQWWLLLVRCLFVLALAFLLAEPYLSRRSGGKGWVMVSGSGGTYGRMIDSLVKEGYERHALADSIDYWGGFREADGEAPGGLPFYIVTTGLAKRFSGERPVSAREVHWYTYTPEDSISDWVQAAWRDSGTVRVLGGYSRSTGTEWRRRGADAGPVAVDTAVFRYRIVADGVWRGDGKYVKAALEALRQLTGRPVEEGDGGWLFWLSDRPLPPTGGYTRVWCYASGATLSVDTRMEGVTLTKEIAGAGVDSAVWKDAYGRGVLTKRGKVYSYYSRLEPGWGDLVWNGRWPVLLKELLFGRIEAGQHDRRVMDPAQVAPLRMGRVMAGLEKRDLRPAVWVMVFLLFLLERIIAYYNGSRKT
jgi:hypothetical protein